MTKQELIKQAWGEALKGAYCDENGWSLMGYFLSEYKIEYDSVLNNDVNYYRPKSLQGIENNNGWTKIENEDDLPKESGWYDFQVYPQKEYKPNPTYWHNSATKIGWFFETYTHYKLIGKDNHPLY